MPSVLEVADLRKRYRKSDRWAVDGVSLRIDEGQAVGLLGPNGAGKSTAVKMIVGLLRPDAGVITLFGRRGAGPHDLLGFAPEAPDFPRFLSAPELIDYFGRLLGLRAIERGRRARECLEWAGLGEERRQVRWFSKGMKQRLVLAQALLGRPRLLILDEPTADLDPLGRRDVRELISVLKNQGTAILLNSHLLSEVERVCDRVSILAQGKMLATGTVDEVVPEGKTLEEAFIETVAKVDAGGGTIPPFIAGDHAT